MMFPRIYGPCHPPPSPPSSRTIITRYGNGMVTIEVQPSANGYLLHQPQGFFCGSPPPSSMAEQNYRYPPIGTHYGFNGARFIQPCESPSQYALPDMSDPKEEEEANPRRRVPPPSPSPYKPHLNDNVQKEAISPHLRTRESSRLHHVDNHGHSSANLSNENEVFEVKSAYAMDYMKVAPSFNGNAQAAREEMRVVAAAAVDGAVVDDDGADYYLDTNVDRLPAPFSDLPNIPENQMRFFGKLFDPPPPPASRSHSNVVNASNENINNNNERAEQEGEEEVDDDLD